MKLKPIAVSIIAYPYNSKPNRYHVHSATTHVVQAKGKRNGYNFRVFEVNNLAGLVDKPQLDLDTSKANLSRVI